MSNVIAFYTDLRSNQSMLSPKVMKAVKGYLSVSNSVFLTAQSAVGFQSGIDWEFVEKLNVIAVVLYSVNDACVVGISTEIEQRAKIEVYEIFDDKLFKLSDPPITKKKEVLDLG